MKQWAFWAHGVGGCASLLREISLELVSLWQQCMRSRLFVFAFPTGFLVFSLSFGHHVEYYIVLNLALPLSLVFSSLVLSRSRSLSHIHRVTITQSCRALLLGPPSLSSPWLSFRPSPITALHKPISSCVILRHATTACILRRCSKAEQHKYTLCNTRDPYTGSY